MPAVVMPAVVISVSAAAEPSNRSVWPAVAAFACALAARLWGIGDKPFWLDELTTLRRAALPMGALIRDSLSYHHLPTYFALLSGVLALGQSEAVARAPSAVLGAVTCAFVAAAAMRVGGRAAGLLAGLLMAFSPIQVQYGQEARSYTLVMCCIAAALLGLLRLVEEPARDADRAGWALLLGGTFGAVATLGIALAWPAASTLGWALATRDTRRRGRWRTWLLGHAAVAVLIAPWFAAMYVLNEGRMADGLTWIPPLDADRLWATFDTVYLMRIGSLISTHLFPAGVPGLGALVALLAVASGVWAWRRRRAAFAVLAVAALLPPVALLAVSTVFPLWIPRYLLWGAVPFFVLAGLGANLAPPAARLPGALAAGVLAAINLGGYYGAETKPRWDQAAQALHARATPRDLVLVEDDRLPDLLNYFLALDGAPLAERRWTLDPAVARAWLAGGSPVWLAQGAVGQVVLADPAVIPPALQLPERPALLLRFGRDVALLRFDPPP